MKSKEGSPACDPEKKKKRNRLIQVATAVAVAATPGVYSAWQGAKAEWKARREIKVRDTQEGDLQQAVKANAAAIGALKESMITHKDLLELVMQLRAERHSRRPTRVHRPRTNAPPPAPAPALAAEMAKLRGKAQAEDKAREKAAKALKRAPELKPAQAVRKKLEQRAAF